MTSEGCTRLRHVPILHACHRAALEHVAAAAGVRRPPVAALAVVAAVGAVVPRPVPAGAVAHPPVALAVVAAVQVGTQQLVSHGFRFVLASSSMEVRGKGRFGKVSSRDNMQY